LFICFSFNASGAEHVRVFPYDTLVDFHEEYVVHCKMINVHPDNIAGIGTFRKAWAQVSMPISKGGMEFRLLGSKGSFKCCEICNNANFLLKSQTRRFTVAQREVLIKFKFKHRKQQEAERLHLDLMREQARSSKDPITGHPTKLFMFTGDHWFCALVLLVNHILTFQIINFADGTTAHTCITPRKGKGRQTHFNQHFESRYIGVEVICGDVIDTTLLYFTGHGIRGGSNMMIEVQRQGTVNHLLLIFFFTHFFSLLCASNA